MGPFPSNQSTLTRWLLLAGCATLLLAARSVLGAPATVYVDATYTSGSAGGHTWGVDAFATIQAGVNAVDIGGTVNVAAGSYATGANLNKSVTLLGAQAGVDARDGRVGASETVITGGGLGVFTLNAVNITFDGFTFSNLKGRTIDTYFNADNFTMRNCILAGASIDPGYNTGAIQFGGGQNLHANDLLFEQNLVTADNGQLLYLGHAMDNGTVRNNKFNGDTASFGPFGNRTGWVIEGNEFNGNVPGHGPYWGFGFNANLGNVVIRNNNVHEMNVGLGQISVAGGLIAGNTFANNAYAAFQLWGGEWGSVVSGNVLIQNNTITYNGKTSTGFADAAHGIRLRPKDITFDPNGIDASTIHLHYNTFTDLGVGTAGTAWAIRQNADGTVDAESNAWGTVVDVQIAAMFGQGAVDYTPWLGAPPATISVSGGGDLVAAISGASQGAMITVADGTYNGGSIVVANGTITVTGSAVNLNWGMLNGDIVAGSGAIIQGNGTIQHLTLNAGSSMDPGASPGTLNATDTTWGGGASYNWQINKADGTAGADPGWDWLNVIGTLTIAADNVTKFNLNASTLTLANAAGSMDSFDNTRAYVWKIASASGGISGFSADKFNVVTTDFANALGGGTLSLLQSGNDLNLVFMPAASVTVAAVFVDDGYVGLLNGTPVNFPYTGSGSHTIGYDAFATIQAGVNKTAVAGTVNVAAGTYAENVLVNKRSTLAGAGSGTIIDPVSGNGITIVSAGSGLDAAQRTVIRDLRVTGAEQGVRFDSGATIGFVTLENVVADHNSLIGVNFRETSTYADIRLVNVESAYNASAGVGLQATALTLDGLTITGGSIHDNTGSGLLALGGSINNVTVTGVAFSANAKNRDTDADIVLSGFNGNAAFTDLNIASDNADAAIRLTGNSSPLSGAGTVAFFGVNITGTQRGAAIALSRYNGVSGVSFNNVVLNSTAPAGLHLGSVDGTLALDNTVFSGNYTAAGFPGEPFGVPNPGSVVLGKHRGVSGADATVSVAAAAATFTGAADSFAKEARVYHKIDNSALGLVTWTAGGNEVFVPVGGSIQRGIDAVPSGGTVNVAAGGYSEALVINRPLTLLGPQANVQPVAGGRAGGEAVLTLNSVDHPLQIVADNVTINGFELTGFFYGPEIQFAAVNNAQRSNVTLAYNYIHSDRCWTGVVVGESVGSGNKNASGNCLVSDVTIAHNIIDVNVDNRPGYTSNRAFSFTTGFARNYGVNYVIYRNITIANNTVNFSGIGGPATGNGTMLFAGGGTTSIQSEFHFENFRCTDNLVSNFRTVINAMNMRGATFQRNTIQNVRGGFYVNLIGTSEAPVQFTDNVFEGVLTGYALDLAGNAYAPMVDTYVNIAGNTFNYNQVVYASQYAPIWLDPGVNASTITIAGNNFLKGSANVAPAAAVQNDSGTGTVDARYNWWGAAGGPTGDQVSANVTYSPWLGYTVGHVPQTFVANSGDDLLAAIMEANANDIITVADGSYNGGSIVVSSGVITVTGAALDLNWTVINRDIVVATGATIRGNGTIGDLTLNLGGSMAPGASPGTINSTDTTWAGGATYNWEINKANGTAGADPGWDLLNVTGTLTITATAGSPFTINLNTLTLANAAGSMDSFNCNQSYTWKIASATVAVTGFSADKFTINTAGFANPTFGGTFAVTQTGNDINVTFTPNAAAPSGVYVDDGYVGLANGTVVKFPAGGGGADHAIGYDAFATIQAAINKAAAAGTVNVAAGTYAERVTISKALTLSGAQVGVDPTPGGARTTPAAEAVITEAGLSTPNPDVLIEIPLGVNGVVIQGFTLNGDTLNTTSDTSVIRCWGNGAVVRDNIIDGMFGVIFKGGTGFTFERNRLTVNKAGFVVQPGAASNINVGGNSFALGASPQSDPSAINLTGVTGGTVSGNTASGFVGGGTGRALAGSGINNVLVSGNSFTGNRDAISIFGGSTFITITNNVLSGSARYGINIKGSDLLITDNTLANNATAGIVIDQNVNTSVRVTVENNTVSGSATGVVVTGAGTEVSLVNNNLSGNTQSVGPVGGTTVIGTGNTVVGGTTITVTGTFTINGVTLSGNDVILNNLGILNGNGTVGGLTINTGGTVAPGASPGTINAGATVWNGGGIYDWQINNATGSKGADPGWDWLNITGTLTINATAGSKFNVNLKSLTLGNVAGAMANFNNAQAYTWVMASASGGITGFDPAAFNLDTSGMVPANNASAYCFTIQQTGNDIEVKYTPNSAPTVVNAIPDQSGTYGSAFSFQFGANTFADVDSAAPASQTLTYSASGMPPGISFTPGTRTFSGTPTAAGTYTVTVTATDNGIPALSVNDQFDIVVAKEVLTVTADAKSRAYGAANPVFTATITGYVLGDTIAVVSGAPSFSTPANATSPVSPPTYPITPALGSLAAANYSFAFVDGALTVTTAALTITAHNQSKTYGQTLVLDGATGFTPTGLQNGETVGSVTLTASGGLAATEPVSGSPYTITPSAATGGTFTAANYSISYVAGTLTVNRAVLSVTADSRRKQQGVANDPAAFTYVISGYVNGETSAVVNNAPNITTAVVTGTAAGAYPINVDVSPMSAANYSFLGVAGTYDVMAVLALPLDMVVGDRGPSVEKGTIVLLSGVGSVTPNTQYTISTAIKSPYEIDLDANRNYIVVDNADYSKTFNTFGVWRIDKNTLARTLISRGGSLVSPMGVKVATNGVQVGKYVVVDSDAFNDGANQWGAVIIINPALPWPGNQTVLSSRLVGAGADKFYWPLGAALAPDGNSVYVSDQGEPTDHAGHPARIFQVDLTTGARTVVFTATVGATTNLNQPVGLAVESDGSSLVVADAEGQRLLRVTIPGAVLSTVSATNAPYNAPFIYPTHVAIRPDTGNYIVTDAKGITGSGLAVGGRHIFEVNKATGAVTVLTTDGFLEQPRGVVIVP